MKHLFSIVLVVGSLFSCCPDKDKGLFFVIKPSECPDSTECYPDFYGGHNFIFYDDTTIYYHRFPKNLCGRCGTGLDPNKPPFMDLTPEKMVKVPVSKFHEFWVTHILKRECRYTRTISISSPQDTIYNKAILTALNPRLIPEGEHVEIHRPTEEELFVSQAKFSGSDYDPEKIKWKIGFDHGDVPPTKKTLQFVPPIPEQ